MLAGSSQALISSVTDPIRSRIFFLDLLGVSQKLPYLDQLISEMAIYLSETKAHLDETSKTDELFDYLGSLGAVKITEARLEWLRIVRKRVT